MEVEILTQENNVGLWWASISLQTCIHWL